MSCLPVHWTFCKRLSIHKTENTDDSKNCAWIAQLEPNNIFTGNDSTELTSNNNTHKVELYTSSCEHWCGHRLVDNVQPCFPIEAIIFLFSTVNLSQKEKSRIHIGSFVIHHLSF